MGADSFSVLRPRRTSCLILFRYFDTGEVEFQNILIAEALLRHRIRAPLAHTDAVAPACAAERPACSSFCGLTVISGIIIAVILVAAAVSTVIAVRRIIFAVIGRLVGRADDDHAFRVPVHRKAERIADVAQDILSAEEIIAS